jgi:glycosyltransferase EpsF
LRNGETKRVLHIVSAMDRGGAETLIMNVYRNIDRALIQFDFVVHRPEFGEFDEEILAMGGKIIRVPSLGSIGSIAYIKELIKIMKLHPYIAVHSHTDYQSGFPSFAAKLAGIPNRICHSHSTNWHKGNGLKENLVFKTLQMIIKSSATKYCSCSEEAAIFLFGKKVLGLSETYILKNGIDFNQFTQISLKSRNNLRQELMIPVNAKIIGHVGTFSKSKNQIFILQILKSLLERDSNFVVIFAGDGPLRSTIEAEANRLGILKNVRFLGVRDDVPILTKIFDVFLFPSLFEGFGIAPLEAQSAGTPCILSDTIPKSVDLGLGLVKFISINENIDVWCEKIRDSLAVKRPDSKTIYHQVLNKGFSIQNNIKEWLDLYGVNVV